MITLTDVAQDVLTRSYRYYVRAESWLGDELLAADIPIETGSEESDGTLRIPERVVLTVPREVDGFSWSPQSDRHPLAANGQRLRVELGIGLANAEVEWFTRGWFLVHDTDTSGDTVTVTATGLYTYLDEARLVTPYQPSGTLASTLLGLVEPALTVDIDTGLVDRAVPAAVNYDEDRLGAVLELLDSWPATASVTNEGYLSVIPAVVSTTSVLSLTDGTGGTVIKSSGSSTREGAANVIVARGTAADGGQVQGVAYDFTSGPKSITGQFNPLPVPEFFDSPLLTSVLQCQAAARTRLARRQKRAARGFDVEMVPHPALQLDDVVDLTTRDFTALVCVVESMTLPYRPSGGAHMLRVREVVS